MRPYQATNEALLQPSRTLMLFSPQTHPANHVCGGSLLERFWTRSKPGLQSTVCFQALGWNKTSGFAPPCFGLNVFKPNPDIFLEARRDFRTVGFVNIASQAWCLTYCTVAGLQVLNWGKFLIYRSQYTNYPNRFQWFHLMLHGKKMLVPFAIWKRPQPYTRLPITKRLKTSCGGSAATKNMRKKNAIRNTGHKVSSQRLPVPQSLGDLGHQRKWPFRQAAASGHRIGNPRWMNDILHASQRWSGLDRLLKMDDNSCMEKSHCCYPWSSFSINIHCWMKWNENWSLPNYAAHICEAPSKYIIIV